MLIKFGDVRTCGKMGQNQQKVPCRCGVINQFCHIERIETTYTQSTGAHLYALNAMQYVRIFIWGVTIIYRCAL